MRRRLFLTICLFVSIVLLVAPFEAARGQANEWKGPYQLSSNGTTAGTPALVADPYGNVHVFWPELLPNLTTAIQYARYDGISWTPPIDIFVVPMNQPVTSVSAAIDGNGILHLIWVIDLAGVVFYTNAPVQEAYSAQSWAKPVDQRLFMKNAQLKVDSKGTLHLAYMGIGDTKGIYHVAWEDAGGEWSDPVQIDPDIPSYMDPDVIEFEIDEAGGLHVVWSYLVSQMVDTDLLEDTYEDPLKSWVRYAHRIEAGEKWSRPHTISSELLSESNGVAFASPTMAVQGETVHIIWSAGDLLYRNYISSPDRGTTWLNATRVFGGINGSAGDGMIVDGLNRIHFFGQLRFPQAVYHSIYEEERWNTPNIVYLIRYTGDDPLEGQIHAHSVIPVIRLGNQVVLTFMDPPPQPNRRLFVMTYTLDDTPQTPALPLPQVSAVEMSPTQTPTPAESAPTVEAPDLASNDRILDIRESPEEFSPGFRIWTGVVPVLLLVGITIVIKTIIKRQQ